MSIAHVARPAAPARVLHIGSRRIVAPMLGCDASFEQRFDWLRREVADQLAEALDTRGGTTPLHFICSTILSKLVGGWPARARSLCETIEQRTGLRTSGLLQGYQCTGWGYALRFAAQHAAQRRLLLSIVDADLHDLMSTGYEEAIGGIGFGVTTVGLDLGDAPELPHCDGPFPNHGFTDLLHAVRAQHKRHGQIPTFLPFLPEGLSGIVRRMLSDAAAPNRHAHYGHVFGSDPWIGLAEWLQRERPDGEHDVLLGAFAYDGYCTTGRVRAGACTRVALRPDLTPEGLPAQATP